MASHVRSGYPLGTALERTGAGVQPGLIACLRVGEERGCLVEELESFARRTARFTMRKYHRAIGRRPEAVDFAAALARLLRDHHLTVRAIRDAGQLSTDGRGRFSGIIEDVARRVEDGRSTFPNALAQHPRHFDGLFRGFLESASSRDEMRRCLERLGERP